MRAVDTALERMRAASLEVHIPLGDARLPSGHDSEARLRELLEQARLLTNYTSSRVTAVCNTMISIRSSRRAA